MRQSQDTPFEYAVTRRWNDNPADSQVLEYFATQKECEDYIREQPRDSRYHDQVSLWTLTDPPE